MDSAAGIWRNEAKFLNDYLVVQNEPPAVICERQEQRDLQPNDHGPGRKRRSSEFTLDSRSAPPAARQFQNMVEATRMEVKNKF